MSEVTASVSDTGAATETVSAKAIRWARDSALAIGVVAGVMWTFNAADTAAVTARIDGVVLTAGVVDKAGATEHFAASQSFSVTDAAGAKDRAPVGFGPNVTDVSGASDAALPQYHARAFVTDVAVAYGRALPASRHFAADAAGATDSAIPNNAAMAQLRDVAGISDRAAAQLERGALVLDQGGADDGASASLDCRALAADVAGGSDRALLPYVGSAWTANTDTFGMSRYESLHYRCPTVMDGVLYAIGDNGIVAMDADYDEGAEIFGHVESGLSDFGQDALKRLTYAYVGYTATAPLAFKLSHVQGGSEQPYCYDMPERWAEHAAPARFRFGRGARSRYWRWLIGNPYGEPFSVRAIDITVDLISRRV